MDNEYTYYLQVSIHESSLSTSLVALFYNVVTIFFIHFYPWHGVLCVILIRHFLQESIDMFIDANILLNVCN